MDLHRILLNGGVYMYPGDNQRSGEHPGKLRLIYEAAPPAFLVPQAGGYASKGVSRIFKIKPTKLNQTEPLFIGTEGLVEQAEALGHKYRPSINPYPVTSRP